MDLRSLLKKRTSRQIFLAIFLEEYGQGSGFDAWFGAESAPKPLIAKQTVTWQDRLIGGFTPNCRGQ